MPQVGPKPGLGPAAASRAGLSDRQVHKSTSAPDRNFRHFMNSEADFRRRSGGIVLVFMITEDPQPYSLRIFRDHEPQRFGADRERVKWRD